ncbi:hypothetical protein ABIA00_006242 [Bradyrhizobium ottawaense]|uniref:hypothetical protein n=1 Tax=Bradyrhizobium ottawaense TaxID=931866 RepID=UPI0038386BC8
MDFPDKRAMATCLRNLRVRLKSFVGPGLIILPRRTRLNRRGCLLSMADTCKRKDTLMALLPNQRRETRCAFIVRERQHAGC